MFGKSSTRTEPVKAPSIGGGMNIGGQSGLGIEEQVGLILRHVGGNAFRALARVRQYLLLHL